MGFYDTLSRYYDILFPASPLQVDFVSERVPDGGSILDVAAGTGNLAVELSKLGFQVTAIDVAPAMIARMEEKQRTGTDGGFEAMLMDMRGLGGLPAQAYDAVLCLGNSLPHLNDLTEIADAVIRMYDRLKAGGTLVLQTVNFDRILRDHVHELPLLERQSEGVSVIFQRFYELEEDGILFKGLLSVEADGKKEVYENTVRLLPLQSDELLQIAEQYGLPVPELYGDFRGEPFGPGSAAMIAVLRKPAG